MSKKKEMRSLDELLEEAKWGKLTTEELAYIVNLIENSKPPGVEDHLYIAIYALGRAGVEYREPHKHRKLLEKFLYYPYNPMITYITLMALCNCWCFTKEYLDQIKMFIKKVDWDEEDDVQMIAISIAGSYCRYNKDKDLLKLLISVFENPQEDTFIRGCAYKALARAMGKEYQDITAPEYVFDLLDKGELDTSVINKAKSYI